VSVLHCHYCGTENQVSANVIGASCDICGQPMFRSDVEDRIAKELPVQKALVNRTDNVDTRLEAVLEATRHAVAEARRVLAEYPQENQY
jgi:predicted  nucleic acid-binding Zn-ribbon protein